MRRSGKSIQKIKPCFLMSPLTVAQYFEPGKFKFDLVVIDESLQIRPEYALSGIARADQIVVVGDPKQLPPNSTFQSVEIDNGIEHDGATKEDFQCPESISARERDVIHQQVLEGLGWHIYRIWSTDWFASPEKEFAKLKKCIQERLDNNEKLKRKRKVISDEKDDEI
ncbi:hypothetical protein CAXC1_110011 [Candidatus Xenohaliotis californiensis]|uniref:DNA2/NAM7 helicase helicase domain-containing protein n=1 Tax=Candidatus Xenohaliotis californiensis TaxID=84677 RepID=A0ABP0EUS3_9RICK|nr:hypothetical protein CAXC1_110011 [Candidatus Xenohaliotis californiensis]